MAAESGLDMSRTKTVMAGMEFPSRLSLASRRTYYEAFFSFAAERSASALFVRSQVKPSPSRPKWP